MIAIAAIDNLLNRNPGLTMLLILILFGVSTANVLKINEEVDKLSDRVNQQTYEYSFRLISRGFDKVMSSTDALEKTKEWKKLGWDAQLVALETLCSQPERTSLLLLIDSNTAKSVCRIVR
jgi:hypothetical protein